MVTIQGQINTVGRYQSLLWVPQTVPALCHTTPVPTAPPGTKTHSWGDHRAQCRARSRWWRPLATTLPNIFTMKSLPVWVIWKADISEKGEKPGNPFWQKCAVSQASEDEGWLGRQAEWPQNPIQLSNERQKKFSAKESKAILTVCIKKKGSRFLLISILVWFQ